MANILAIDDEQKILNMIEKTLQKENHRVKKVTDPSSLDIDEYRKYDLILLDIMMPGTDGITLCKRIRESVDCPVIFLTAKTFEQDIIEGLGAGADDYITKPFDIGELRARVNAHLRRENRTRRNAFTIDGVRFDMSAWEISCNHRLINFTKSEYQICEYLALNHGQVFSKEQILEKVCGYDSESDTSAIVEHIKNIRGKFAVASMCPIETVWGIGYKWK